VTTTTADRSLQALWQGLERLPEMDEAQFDRWATLLKERTGMTMPRERKSFLVTSVGLRMRELGYERYEAYYDYLTSGRAGNVEWMALVDRLTVHETRFFRDARALQFVVSDIVPRMVERVRSGEHAQVWSAGCATGEEAFTLAMLVDYALSEAGLPQLYGVIGTDISLQSLSVARQGIYPERRYKHIPEYLRGRYTVPNADGKGGFQISAALRRRVCFAQFNILDASCTPPGSMDLVYCQNVLIYFDRETRAKILDGLVRPLRRGGVLVLGAGEMIGWEHPHMERTGDPDVLAYRRVKD